MTEREILMKKIATSDFALVDLHLFLDTHPNSRAIAEKIRDYEMKSRALRKEYEEKYGPITPRDENGNRWAWIAGPWPWEIKEEKCDVDL